MRFNVMFASACALVLAAPGTAANLINDPGFEQVATPDGGLTGPFSAGEAVGGWTALGKVYLLNTNYTEPGASVPAHSGSNSANFATDSDSGVEQTVTTTIGASYRLAFWLGDLNSTFQPIPSTVTVRLNDIAASSFTYVSTSLNVETWQEFSLTFQAATALTKISFFVPEFNDNFVGLDDVSLDLAPSSPAGVPEPATWATMLLGFGLIGAAVRRRRTALA